MKNDSENGLYEIIQWAEENNIPEEDLPRNMNQLKSLTELNLSHLTIQCTELPESIGSLVNLTTLDASNCGLMYLPESIGELKNLKELKLGCFFHVWGGFNHRSNSFVKLPESIGKLENLTILDVRRSSLTSLPESIGSLNNLVELRIGQNPLNSIPENLKNKEGLIIDVEI